MAIKQKVTANGTYVFDPDEIEQLDELSLTSILPAVADDASQQAAPESEAPDVVAPGSLGNTTISELLSDQLEPDDEPPLHTGLPLAAEPAQEASDDLIDPQLLFPELPTNKRRKAR